MTRLRVVALALSLASILSTATPAHAGSVWDPNEPGQRLDIRSVGVTFQANGRMRITMTFFIPSRTDGSIGVFHGHQIRPPSTWSSRPTASSPGSTSRSSCWSVRMDCLRGSAIAASPAVPGSVWLGRTPPRSGSRSLPTRRGWASPAHPPPVGSSVPGVEARSVRAQTPSTGRVGGGYEQRCRPLGGQRPHLRGLTVARPGHASIRRRPRPLRPARPPPRPYVTRQRPGPK